MKEISHKFIEVNNGLKLHVAEACFSSPSPQTPVVLLLHGFPEIWYSWRHQMMALAKAGYRAIAPDLRGYGFSDIPPQPEKTTFSDTAADLVTLLDNLSISKVFIISKDSGSFVASIFVVLHQERVSGLITIDVPFIAPSPVTYSDHLPEGFYITRWKEPGRAEADFGRFDVKTVLKNIYILFSRPEIPIASQDPRDHGYCQTRYSSTRLVNRR
ncbi:hydrolase [Lithospermum erythrorhizon]|uniref:Hydrolase n=1 Tax=Lithospermum erythrorhizon TaxID=34254 RepID=A0AAV3RJ17_LITER